MPRLCVSVCLRCYICVVLCYTGHNTPTHGPALQIWCRQPATRQTVASGKWPPVITRYDHHKAPHLSLCLACVATWHTCHQGRILSTYCLELSIVSEPLLHLSFIYIYAMAILSSQPHLPSTFRPPLGEVQLYKRSAFCLQTSCFNMSGSSHVVCCIFILLPLCVSLGCAVSGGVQTISSVLPVTGSDVPMTKTFRSSSHQTRASLVLELETKFAKFSQSLRSRALLKAVTTLFTLKNPLKHYAKQTPKHCFK